MNFISINNLYFKTKYVSFIYKCNNNDYIIFFKTNNNNLLIEPEIFDTDNFIVNSDRIIEFIMDKNDKSIDNKEKEYIFNKYPFDNTKFKYMFNVLYELYYKKYFPESNCIIGYIYTETDKTRLEKYMNL